MLSWILVLEVTSLFVSISRCISSCLDDRERACTMKDIEQMTYLDCVIKVNNDSLMN